VPRVTAPTTRRPYMTPPELAAELGVEAQKIVDWITAGELAAVNVAADAHGRRPRWRVSREDLELFLRGRANKPRPAPRPRRRKLPVDSSGDFF